MRSATCCKIGPRTRLDAAALSAWIASSRRTAPTRRRGWTAPGLALADLEVDFPDRARRAVRDLHELPRNAQGPRRRARGACRHPRRPGSATSPDGRGDRWPGDSAPAALTLESIEARESGRGLAIVRDLVRAWRGHLVVRPEVVPLAKVVGASFPL